MKKFICIISLAVSIAGCSPAQLAGIGVSTVIGGVAGGFAGSAFGSGSGQTWASIAGAIIGSFIGNSFEPGFESKPPPLPADQAQYLREKYGYESGVHPIYISQEEIDSIEAAFPKNSNGEPVCRLFSTSRNGGFPAIGMVCLDDYGRWRMVDTGSDFYDYGYDDRGYMPNQKFTTYDDSPIYDN